MIKIFEFMAKMISNVDVSCISLVSKGKKPAVPKAENTFSIFKTMKKSIVSTENIQKLTEIQEKYKKDDKDIEKNV